MRCRERARPLASPSSAFGRVSTGRRRGRHAGVRFPCGHPGDLAQKATGSGLAGPGPPHHARMRRDHHVVTLLCSVAALRSGFAGRRSSAGLARSTVVPGEQGGADKPAADPARATATSHCPANDRRCRPHSTGGFATPGGCRTLQRPSLLTGRRRSIGRGGPLFGREFSRSIAPLFRRGRGSGTDLARGSRNAELPSHSPKGSSRLVNARFGRPCRSRSGGDSRCAPSTWPRTEGSWGPWPRATTASASIG